MFRQTNKQLPEWVPWWLTFGKHHADVLIAAGFAERSPVSAAFQEAGLTCSLNQRVPVSSAHVCGLWGSLGLAGYGFKRWWVMVLGVYEVVMGLGEGLGCSWFMVHGKIQGEISSGL